MKRFFVFMIIFMFAFIGLQKAEALDIPCLEKQGNFYKTTLKEYMPSDSEKKEQNFSDSQGISFWEMTDWNKADTTAQCGAWDEKTFNFTFPCKGIFEFHQDIGGPDIFGFYWKQIPNQSPSVGTPTVSAAMVDVNKDVIISFVPDNVDTASYTTSDGQNGSFKRDAAGNFAAILNFSSAGVKTVSISGADSCGTSVFQSISVTVTNLCADNRSPSVTGDMITIENVPVLLPSVMPFPQSVTVNAPQAILISLSVDDPDGADDIDLTKTGLEDKVDSGASSTYPLTFDANVKNTLKGIIQGVGSHELRVIVTDKCGKNYDKTYSFSVSAIQYETPSTPLTPKGDLTTPQTQPMKQPIIEPPVPAELATMEQPIQQTPTESTPAPPKPTL